MTKIRIWLVKLLAGRSLSVGVNLTFTGSIKATGPIVLLNCIHEPQGDVR